jgi:hypothetical protein
MLKTVRPQLKVAVLDFELRSFNIVSGLVLRMSDFS